MSRILEHWTLMEALTSSMRQQMALSRFVFELFLRDILRYTQAMDSGMYGRALVRLCRVCSLACPGMCRICAHSK